MKRFVICLVIIALIITAAAGVEHRLNRSVQALCSALQGVIEAAPRGSRKEVAEKAKAVQALWQQEAAFLHMAEIHRTLEQAEQTMEALPELSQKISREELILSCIEAKQQLQNMARSEKILPENIF